MPAMSWAVHANERELRDVGLVRQRDGRTTDNGDAFYDSYSDDWLRTYDRRTRATYNPCTHAVVSHGLLDRLLAALVFEAEHKPPTQHRGAA